MTFDQLKNQDIPTIFKLKKKHFQRKSERMVVTHTENKVFSRQLIVLSNVLKRRKKDIPFYIIHISNNNMIINYII